MSFVIYNGSKFFTTDTTDNSDTLNCSSKKKISNNVVSMSSVPGLGKAYNLVLTKFEEQPFATNCSHKDNMKRTLKYTCVFWKEENREWDDYGCSYTQNVTADGVLSHYCYCNHTTNFALLMVNMRLIMYIFIITTLCCCCCFFFVKINGLMLFQNFR